MINFSIILEKAKAAQIELKTKFDDEINETRFVVQFNNLNSYQYKSTPDSLKKLAKVDFKDVIMVQIVVGKSVLNDRGYAKFRLRGVKVLYLCEDYDTVAADADAANEFKWE